MSSSEDATSTNWAPKEDVASGVAGDCKDAVLLDNTVDGTLILEIEDCSDHGRLARGGLRTGEDTVRGTGVTDSVTAGVFDGS